MTPKRKKGTGWVRDSCSYTPLYGVQTCLFLAHSVGLFTSKCAHVRLFSSTWAKDDASLDPSTSRGLYAFSMLPFDWLAPLCVRMRKRRILAHLIAVLKKNENICTRATSIFYYPMKEPCDGVYAFRSLKNANGNLVLGPGCLAYFPFKWHINRIVLSFLSLMSRKLAIF